MDIVGLDVVLDIEKHYAAARIGLPRQPQDYLQRMIAKGHLGVKSGQVFYDYKNTGGPMKIK
jgi:3-hydroxyacyl-CoA dehydrogenase